MNWLIIVLAGHFLNALAFLMDKFLLTKKIPSPFVYAFFIGALGILALILIPFGFNVPSAGEIVRALAAGKDVEADSKPTEAFLAKAGLTGDVAWSVFEDREGNIWVGTNGNAIYQGVIAVKTYS